MCTAEVNTPARSYKATDTGQDMCEGKAAGLQFGPRGVAPQEEVIGRRSHGARRADFLDQAATQRGQEKHHVSRHGDRREINHRDDAKDGARDHQRRALPIERDQVQLYGCAIGAEYVVGAAMVRGAA